MSLLSLELRRLFLRNLTRIALGSALVVIIFLGLAMFAGRSAPGRLLCPEEIWTSAESISSCEQPAVGGANPEGVFVPQPRSESVLRPGASGWVPRASLWLLPTWILVGASAVGAEFRERTVETQLLWYPRRVRLLGTRIAGVATVVFVAHIVLLLVVVAVLTPTLLLRGSGSGGGASFWWGLCSHIIRGGCVAAVVATVAAALAFLTRYTAASVSMLLGYSAISPLALDSTSIVHHDPFVNLLAFASGADVGRYVNDEGSNQLSVIYSHGTLGAAILLIAFCALVVAASALAFARRDVV